MKSEDEFDSLEYPELTDEEWALVDTQVALSIHAFQLEGQPVKEIPPPARSPPRRQNYTSPRARRPKYPHRMQAARAAAHGLQKVDLFTTFRPAGSLSVSDLVGPAWCEVKFDYNLRWGRRWERVEQKPDVLVTSKGKRIDVKKAEARKGEVVKDAGVAIHKKLEKALQPVEIEIPVNTKEERWGSKLLTMLSSLQLLRTVGFCREFPVMGFINEILVMGIIDEIVRKPRKRDDSRLAAQAQDIIHRAGISGTTSPKPGDLTAIPQCSDPIKALGQLEDSETNQQPPVEEGPGYSLQLLDHKSRNSRSTPPIRDQYQSRLQLMLYKRLLSALLEPSSLLDIMSRVRVETSAPFSPAFLQTQEYLCASNGLGESVRSSMCLGDLVLAWGESLKLLDIGFGLPINESGSVADELELVYRLREMPKTSWRKRRSLSQEPRPTRDACRAVHEHVLGSDIGMKSSVDEAPRKRPSLEYFERDWEDLALAWAIQEGLKPAEQNAAVFGPALEAAEIPLPESPPAAQEDEGTAELESPLIFSEEAQVVSNPAAINGDPGTAKSQFEQVDPASSSADIRRDDEGLAPIVGISTFQYDEQQLDEYIEDVILFWRGLREPRGVDIEDANRCNSCEFRDGCEWREAKAAGFEAKAPSL